MSHKLYSKTSKSFSSHKNKVQEVTITRKGKKVTFDNVNTFTDEKTKLYYQFERVRSKNYKIITTKGGKKKRRYENFIRTYQVLNPSEVRKKQKPIRKLVDSRRGNSFNESKHLVRTGNIKKSFNRDLVFTDEKGNKTFEYTATSPPKRTGVKQTGKNKGKSYKIQLVAYFDVKFKGRKNIVVMGFSKGYTPDVKRPNKSLLLQEAERRATGEAGHLLGSSDFSLSLNSSFYRYYDGK